MRALFFGILFLVAAGLVAAIVVGVALKLVVFFIAMAAIAAAALYFAGKIYGPPSDLPREGSEFDHVKR
jgi:flagellar biosynthesis protein FliQ